MSIEIACLVALCVVLDSAQHLFFRMAGRHSAHYFRYIAPGVLLYLGVAAIWFHVLEVVPVGQATPLMSMSYVVTALLSRKLFGEQVTPRRWAGIAIIVAGVALLSGGAP